MTNLELIPNSSFSSMGHLFCEECASELNIVLSWYKVYENPQYKPAWDAMWHEFNAVRYIVPRLLRDIHDGQIRFSCPQCHNADIKKLTIMPNGLFDLCLIRNSLRAYQAGFDCVKCGDYYASKKMGAKTGGKYICGDCAALA